MNGNAKTGLIISKAKLVQPETPTTSKDSQKWLDDCISKINKTHLDINDSYFNASISRIINPNYMNTNDGRYTRNCSICSAAFELYMRGENVEAGPRDQINRGIETVFNLNLSDYDSYVSMGDYGTRFSMFDDSEKTSIGHGNPNHFTSNDEYNYNLLVKTMQKWGNNSRAELSVRWRDKEEQRSQQQGKLYISDTPKKQGDGHSLVVVNNNNNIYILDAQNGNNYVTKDQVMKLFRRTIPSGKALFRTDHLTRKTNNMSEQDLMFKKRG